MAMDEQEFLEAYEAHADAIFRRCLFKVSDREAALELSQEIFMKVWEYGASGKEIGNLKAFLYRTTHNMIVDHYRKARPLYERDLGEHGADVLASIPDLARSDLYAELEHVMRCVRKLPDRDRDIVLMRYTDGLPVTEIAEVLEEKQNTVSVWLKRALAAVRACLGLSSRTV
jgi:RNA polymerase sigma-70 factor (ECF subfamily)